MVTKYPESGIFFTSDTHFGHSKIIDYCKRPFSSIEEHDKTLIQNWNNVVGQDDTVFHLGDFAYGNSQFISNIIKQLKIFTKKIIKILILHNKKWECVSKTLIYLITILLFKILY